MRELPIGWHPFNHPETVLEGRSPGAVSRPRKTRRWNSWLALFLKKGRVGTRSSKSANDAAEGNKDDVKPFDGTLEIVRIRLSQTHSISLSLISSPSGVQAPVQTRFYYFASPTSHAQCFCCSISGHTYVSLVSLTVFFMFYFGVYFCRGLSMS